MFATECSKPMVTNAMMGSQIANTRLTISLEAVACHMPITTSQLQRTPLITAWVKGMLVFATATAFTVATEGPAITPEAKTR
jgi:hypothetical protein